MNLLKPWIGRNVPFAKLLFKSLRDVIIWDADVGRSFATDAEESTSNAIVKKMEDLISSEIYIGHHKYPFLLHNPLLRDFSEVLINNNFLSHLQDLSLVHNPLLREFSVLLINHNLSHHCLDKPKQYQIQIGPHYLILNPMHLKMHSQRHRECNLLLSSPHNCPPIFSLIHLLLLHHRNRYLDSQ